MAIRYRCTNHLAFATGDMSATIRFWRDLMGMRMVLTSGGKDSRHYFFDARSPGFSVFAVRLRTPIEPEEIIAPVPTQKPDVSQIKKVTIVAGDEPIEDVLEKEKERLREKVGVSEGEDIEMPIVEVPGDRMWLRALVILVVLTVTVSFVLLRVKAKWKNRKDDE